MAFTDFLFRDKDSGGKNPESKTGTLAPAASPQGTQPQPQELPGLNFPVFLQTPTPASVQQMPDAAFTQTAGVQSPQSGGNPLDELEPQADPQLEALVADLGDRVRKDAGAGYKTFNVMRKRMMDAARGAAIPLDVILAAANVRPSELVEEVNTLGRNLSAAVAELESDITTQENQDTADLQNDAESLDSSIQQKSDQVRSLQEQLNALRAEVSQEQQELTVKNASIRQKKAEANGKRLRLKTARARVLAQLADEKKTFSSR